MALLAIYPGSFDPITNGHSDLVGRAAAIFGEMVVAVATHAGKSPSAFTPERRVQLAREVLAGVPNVQVESFDGLLIDYVRSRGAHVLVRGLRAVSDFEYEFQLAAMNRSLQPEIETLFMMPGEQYTFVSSTLVKEVAALGGDISAFVHPSVAAALQEQFR